MFGPNIDLEAPYQDACKREERYQQIEDNARENLWYELTDELEVEKFIDDWLADPNKLLRDIIHRVAVTQEKISNLRLGADKTLADVQQERLKLRLSAYDSIFRDIEEHIDRVAEVKAQRIYDSE